MKTGDGLTIDKVQCHCTIGQGRGGGEGGGGGGGGGQDNRQGNGRHNSHKFLSSE